MPEVYTGLASWLTPVSAVAERATSTAHLPLLKEVETTTNSVTWVAETPEAFLPICQFPFHNLGFREAKLFKPKKVTEARAICFYTAPLCFYLKYRTVCGVKETKLIICAQIAMLNHANILSVAVAPPVSSKGARFQGYSEDEKIKIKARGVALLNQFMAAPAASRIPLSAGLIRVATGTAKDDTSEASQAASDAEAEQLVPVPLPGVAADTFDDDDEDFE